ncbi:MAG TPA: hypothetical protein VM680_20375 [Verrucomicrobiae bacterium]|nr:hypothetical protein [Verrucomicrobiae bacterium]
MKVCILTERSEMSEQLRRCAQRAIGSPVTDLNKLRLAAWKDTINTADLILIDFTAANPTAAYVAGIADTLNKRVILLSPIAERTAALFEKHRTIVHQWNLEFLKSELQKEAGPTDAEPQIVDDTPAGKFQQHFGDLLRVHGYVHRGPVEFDGSTFTVREQDMDFALVQEIAHRAKSLNLRVRLL